MKKILVAILFLNTLLWAGESNFLQQLKQSLNQEVQAENQRLEEFKKDVSSQQVKLDTLKANLAQQIKLKEELKQKDRQNKLDLDAKQKEFENLLGNLNSILQTTKQVATTANKGAQNSLTAVQFPQNKQVFLDTMNLKTLTKDDLQKFWLALSEEIIQSGQVSSFKAPVINLDGKQNIQNITRIGQISAISDGKYLKLSEDGKSFQILLNQPGFLQGGDAKEFESSQDQVKEVLVDVTRGSLFQMLENSPTLMDRVNQGGIVGYVILFLGFIGLLYAIYKVLALSLISHKISHQLRHIERPTQNPLGFIIKVFNENKDLDMDELELKMGEEVISQSNKINSGKDFVKLVATTTPLLGLLGTVTGMITTFQAITMYGTGDPKLMAGGISAALITTVLGLVTAIPLLFAHSHLNSRSREILAVLEEQSIGLLAKKLSHV